MKRTFLAVSVCLSLPASVAQAYDWSVRSSLSESVEFNDNQFLRPTPLGSVGSYSFLKTDGLVQTPTSRFIIDGDIRYQKYYGPGAEGTLLSESVSSGVHARYEDILRYSPDKNFLDASWRRQNVGVAILGDLGVATPAKGDLDTTTVQAGIERQLTYRDFVTFSGRALSVDYDPSSGGTHYTDMEALGTLRHQIDRRNYLTASSEAELLNYDNATKSSVLIFRQTAGVQSEFTQLVSFTGNAGVAVVDSRQNATSLIPSTTATGLGSTGTSEAFIADAKLTYKMFPTTQISFYARQTVGPSVVGSLTKRTSFGSNLTYNINHSQSMTFGADVTRQTANNSYTDFYSASAGYNYQMTRDWNAQFNYRFLYRPVPPNSSAAVIDPITGITLASAASVPLMSNSFLVTVTRSFTELPPGR